jgi:aldo/keto reductase family protein
MSNPHRREVIKGLTAGIVMSTPLAADSTTTGTVPTRPLGRTGENVSMIGLGGSHIGKPKLSDAEAVRIIRTAIDNGLTFLDNSWDYNDGVSETRVGKALKDAIAPMPS